MSPRYLRVFAIPILAGWPAALLAQQPCSIPTWPARGRFRVRGPCFRRYPVLPLRSRCEAPTSATLISATTEASRYVSRRSPHARAGPAYRRSPAPSSVSPDCTATVTAPTAIPGFTSREQFMILDHGNEIWTLALNGLNAKPAVWQCQWRKLSPSPWTNLSSNCSAGLIHGTYAGKYDGVLLPADCSAPAPSAPS